MSTKYSNTITPITNLLAALFVCANLSHTRNKNGKINSTCLDNTKGTLNSGRMHENGEISAMPKLHLIHT